MANRKSSTNTKTETQTLTPKKQPLILPVTILLNPRVLYANLLSNTTNLSSCAVSTSSSGSSKSTKDSSSNNLFLNVSNIGNGNSPGSPTVASTSSIGSTDKEYFMNMYGNSAGSLNSAECTTPTSVLYDSSESGHSDSSDSFSSLQDPNNVLPNPNNLSISPNNCQANALNTSHNSNNSVPYYHQNFYYQDQPVPKTNSDEIIESLKHKFLDFCEDQAKMANEFEIKLMFLEHFFDPINEKVPSKVFKSVESVFSRLDLFCKVLITLKMPYESVEIEKLRSESLDKVWFYLKYLPSQLDHTPLFRHVYLREFLQTQSVSCKDPRHVLLSKEEVHHNTAQSEEQRFTVGLIDEIKLICNMFLLELGDWFAIFEFKQNKKVRKWFEQGLVDGTLPKFVIEIYRKKKEKNEKANRDFKFNNEDLNIKHVIDSDWAFSNWMCREHGGDWYLTYSKLPNVMNWNSDEDHSKDKLELRNSKIVGYLDYAVGDVVKSTHFDTHLEYCFHNVQWHYYTPINAASSIQKYPAVIMTSKFDFGPLFSLRGVQFVFSSKSQFHGEKLVENAFLFKSSDFVKNEEIKDLIKCPFVGSRIYNMVDKYRTRYVEARTCNLGGFLNKKFVFTNPISSKKLSMDNYNGIVKAVKEAKEKGNPMPSFSSNYLAKILFDYCKHYCGVDLEKKSL